MSTRTPRPDPEERDLGHETGSREVEIQSDCERIEPILHRYVEGELDRIRSQMVERHIAVCSACLSEKEQLEGALESLEGSSVLTVGEMERFAEMGGIINFVVKKNRLRFEINLDAGRRAGLEISSQLLNLADSVVDDRGRERK